MQSKASSSTTPSGFLLLRKPAGITSHDVVDIVRKKLGTRRVGHAGTLDPMATGLLIVAVGTTTKHLQKILGLSKTYEAEIALGASSTTDDAEGTITQGDRDQGGGDREPTRDEIENVLREFLGTHEQVPPAYSAIKVRGTPAHRRVRRGESIVLPPRTITIHALELLGYTYPRLHIRCTVSSGTYIRALARDIGARLRTGAYLAALSRTAIGPWTLAAAQDPSAITSADLRETLDAQTRD